MLTSKTITRGLTFAATAALAATFAGAALAQNVTVITPYLAQPGSQFMIEGFEAAAEGKGWTVNVIDTQNDVAAVFRSSLPEAERLDADRLVSDLAARGGHARHIPDNDDIIAAIVQEHRDGDVVVLMSNGGFGGIHRKLIRALHDRVSD